MNNIELFRKKNNNEKNNDVITYDKFLSLNENLTKDCTLKKKKKFIQENKDMTRSDIIVGVNSLQNRLTAIHQNNKKSFGPKLITIEQQKPPIKDPPKQTIPIVANTSDTVNVLQKPFTNKTFTKNEPKAIIACNSSVYGKFYYNSIFEYMLPNISYDKLIELKLFSMNDSNTQVIMKINGADNNELIKSNIILDKNWITLNYIDTDLYPNPKKITIEFEGKLGFNNIEHKIIPKSNVVTNNVNLLLNGNNEIKMYKTLIKPQNFRVGVIADNFTYENINYIFDTIYIKPDTDIKMCNINLLLCESTWAGIDESWRNIISNFNANTDKGKRFVNLINFCKKNKIPTVFYAKEDPPFFNVFKNCATLFDLVITTADECVSKYKSIGCKNVFAQPFLINPIIHNPIKTTIIPKIAFPGSYYKFLGERSNVMDKILDNFVKFDQLDIFDRQYFHNKATYQISKLAGSKGACEYPDKYYKLIKPALTYSQVVDMVYKKYKYILNVNTVQNSKTMFSRRVMEACACGTNVISNESVGMRNIFGDNIIYLNEKNKYKLDNKHTSLPNINTNLYETTHLNYTYKHLFNKIFNNLKITTPFNNHTICIVTDYGIKINNNVLGKYPVFYEFTEKLINSYDWIIYLNLGCFEYSEQFIRKLLLPTEYVDEHIGITTDTNIFQFNNTNFDEFTFVLCSKKISDFCVLKNNLAISNFVINNIY